jgi:hypothetical protein
MVAPCQSDSQMVCLVPENERTVVRIVSRQQNSHNYFKIFNSFVLMSNERWSTNYTVESNLFVRLSCVVNLSLPLCQWALTPKLSAPAPRVRLDTRNIVLTPPSGSYSLSLSLGTGTSTHWSLCGRIWCLLAFWLEAQSSTHQAILSLSSVTYLLVGASVKARDVADLAYEGWTLQDHFVCYYGAKLG